MIVGIVQGHAEHPQGEFSKFMCTLPEIENAVRHLRPADLAAFRAWFAEYDAEVWDREFDADVAAGRLDSLAEEALTDLRDGRCTDR